MVCFSCSGHGISFAPLGDEEKGPLAKELLCSECGGESKLGNSSSGRLQHCAHLTASI